jgi:GTP cyclohydrolase I
MVDVIDALEKTGGDKMKEELRKELKRVTKKYEDVCERLDQLNEVAFGYEQDMMYLTSQLEKED